MREVKSLREIPSPIVLPFILVGGIFATFFSALFLEPGSDLLYVFIETIYFTSFAIFGASIVLLIIDFKRCKKSILLWVHLLLGAPLSLMVLYNNLYDYGLNYINTTTPNEFRTEKVVDEILLKQYSNKFESLTDSLLDLHIIGVKEDSATRSFNSELYNDDIERHFAIELTPEVGDLEYLDIRVSNLFYSPNSQNYLVGFLTTKFTNFYAITSDNPQGIDFDSKIFIGKIEASEFEMIALREYNLSCTSIERCNYYMEKNFIKGQRSSFKYNINDVRFWSENNVIERLEAHSYNLRNNILN